MVWKYPEDLEFFSKHREEFKDTGVEILETMSSETDEWNVVERDADGKPVIVTRLSFDRVLVKRTYRK